MRRKKLIKWMIDEDLNDVEVANRLGITRVYWNYIKNGIANPSYELMQKFKDEFHVENVFELFEKER